jgi:hypothetical protein
MFGDGCLDSVVTAGLTQGYSGPPAFLLDKGGHFGFLVDVGRVVCGRADQALSKTVRGLNPISHASKLAGCDRNFGRKMEETEDTHMDRMKRFFVPGPLLLFLTGGINTPSPVFPNWLLVIALLISVPCSMKFWLAGWRAWQEERKGIQ